MKYNEKICEMLDKVVERIKEENNCIQNNVFGGKLLEKYMAQYITEAMEQYKENNTFEMNMTEEGVLKLYNYNDKVFLLRDIIQFVYEDTEKEYPLVLDFWLCYEMVIDFVNDLKNNESYCVKCSNCGQEFAVQRENIIFTENGRYVICKKCGYTIDY